MNTQTEQPGINTVGVVGLGQLGRGVAACFLAHGFRVIGVSLTDDELTHAETYIAQAVRELVGKADFPQKLASQWQQQYSGTLAYDRLSDCDFVVESVTEDVAVKQAAFRRIEAVVEANVPIASNTSSLPITTLQATCEHPDRILGMHWAEPSYATRFMELIRGEQTSDAAFQRAFELTKRIDKDAALVKKDVPAFIVNRLEYAIHREALNILEQGVADVETIDRAFRNAVGLWGAICGPFRIMDMHGGPELYAKVMEKVWPTLSNASELSPALEAFSNEEGDCDQETFHQYDTGEREQWQNLMTEHAWDVYRLHREHFPINEPVSSGSGT